MVCIGLPNGTHHWQVGDLSEQDESWKMALAYQRKKGTSPFQNHHGDVTNNQQINAADRSEVWNNRNKSGIYGADCNLDGQVDAADRSIVWNNRNQESSIP